MLPSWTKAGILSSYRRKRLRSLWARCREHFPPHRTAQSYGVLIRVVTVLTSLMTTSRRQAEVDLERIVAIALVSIPVTVIQ